MTPTDLAQIRERDIEHEHQSCSRGLCAIADRDRRALLAHISYLGAQLRAQQAKIDALMLEYCPEEMTAEQRTEWARNQVPASDAEKKAMRRALGDETGGILSAFQEQPK